MLDNSFYKKQEILATIEHQELRNNISDELLASRKIFLERAEAASPRMRGAKESFS